MSILPKLVTVLAILILSVIFPTAQNAPTADGPLREELRLTDTPPGHQIEKSLADFEVKYDTLQKDLREGELANQVLSRERAMLWMALCLTVAIGLGLFLFTRQKRLKNKLEIERSRSYIQGMEEERRAFARELHDGVAADLLALRLNLSDANGANARAAEMAERLRMTIRSISHQLMPPEFGEHSLGEIIKRYVETISTGDRDGTLVSANFVEADMPAKISEHTCREIYRIFQEEMSNILRHGRPSHIDVALQGSPDGTVTLTIDHDSALSEDEGGATSTGIGRRTIEERLRIIDAQLERSKHGNTSSSKLTLKLK